MIEWEWYKDGNTARVFFHILINAYFDGFSVDGYEIKRGSFITSVGRIGKELGLSVQSVRTALNKLKSTGEISVIATHKYSIVIVNNYDKYQVATKSTREFQHTKAQISTNHQQSENGLNTEKMSVDIKTLTNEPENFNKVSEKNQQHNKEDILKKKIIKEKRRKRPHGKFSNVYLSDSEIDLLRRDYPDFYLDKITRLSCYLMNTNKEYDNHYLKLVEWIEADKVADTEKLKRKNDMVTHKASYDIAELEKIE